MNSLKSIIKNIIKENFNQDIIPDYIVDTFYERIKKYTDIGLDFKHPTIVRELNRIRSINNNIIPDKIKQLLNINDNDLNENEDFDYHGEHSAPSKTEDDTFGQLYDLTKMYGGEDIYTSNAYKYFGQHDPLAIQAISIIQSVRNKPNALIKIYRAIPDFNYEIDKKIKNLNSILFYYDKFGFFPMKNSIIHSIENKYKDLQYDEQQKSVYKDIVNQINNLSNKKTKLPKINNGDWVTTVRDYAVEHGKDNLKNNYKIISKTVRVKDLYNSGDSVLEYGYSV